MTQSWMKVSKVFLAKPLSHLPSEAGISLVCMFFSLGMGWWSFCVDGKAWMSQILYWHGLCVAVHLIAASSSTVGVTYPSPLLSDTLWSASSVVRHYYWFWLYRS